MKPYFPIQFEIFRELVKDAMAGNDPTEKDIATGEYYKGDPVHKSVEMYIREILIYG